MPGAAGRDGQNGSARCGSEVRMVADVDGEMAGAADGGGGGISPVDHAARTTSVRITRSRGDGRRRAISRAAAGSDSGADSGAAERRTAERGAADRGGLEEHAAGREQAAATDQPRSERRAAALRRTTN